MRNLPVWHGEKDEKAILGGHCGDRHLDMGTSCGTGAAAIRARPAPEKKEAADLPKPTGHTDRKIEGWTVRVDNRLLEGPDQPLGTKALRFLENKLSDITMVVPPDKLKKLQSMVIVLDLSHGNLTSMQYHPSAGWLKEHGYSPDLVKCVHLPRAADLPTKRNINEQPWVILHELAHAYHDQVLGFEDARIKEVYENYKKSGHGDKTLLFNGHARQTLCADESNGILRRNDRSLFRGQRFLSLHARGAQGLGAGDL